MGRKYRSNNGQQISWRGGFHRGFSGYGGGFSGNRFPLFPPRGGPPFGGRGRPAFAWRPPNSFRPNRPLLPFPPVQPLNPPPKPPSPLPGSEEARQRAIDEASARIKEQLERGETQTEVSIPACFPCPPPDHRIDVPIKTTSELSQNTVTPKKKTEKPKTNVSAVEVHKKILNSLSNMTKGRLQNFVNAPSTKYDAAIQPLIRDKRLLLSKELREMYNTREQDSQSECKDMVERFNSIVPDCGIDLVNLPNAVVQQLSNILQLDSNDDMQNDSNDGMQNDSFEDIVIPEQMFKEAEKLLEHTDNGDMLSEFENVDCIDKTIDFSDISDFKEDVLENFCDVTLDNFAAGTIDVTDNQSSNLDENMCSLIKDCNIIENIMDSAVSEPLPVPNIENDKVEDNHESSVPEPVPNSPDLPVATANVEVIDVCTANANIENVCSDSGAVEEESVEQPPEELNVHTVDVNTENVCSETGTAEEESVEQPPEEFIKFSLEQKLEMPSVRNDVQYLELINPMNPADDFVNTDDHSLETSSQRVSESETNDISPLLQKVIDDMEPGKLFLFNNENNSLPSCSKLQLSEAENDKVMNFISKGSRKQMSHSEDVSCNEISSTNDIELINIKSCSKSTVLQSINPKESYDEVGNGSNNGNSMYILSGNSDILESKHLKINREPDTKLFEDKWNFKKKKKKKYDSDEYSNDIPLINRTIRKKHKSRSSSLQKRSEKSPDTEEMFRTLSTIRQCTDTVPVKKSLKDRLEIFKDFDRTQNSDTSKKSQEELSQALAPTESNVVKEKKSFTLSVPQKIRMWRSPGEKKFPSYVGKKEVSSNEDSEVDCGPTEKEVLSCAYDISLSPVQETSCDISNDDKNKNQEALIKSEQKIGAAEYLQKSEGNESISQDRSQETLKAEAVNNLISKVPEEMLQLEKKAEFQTSSLGSKTSSERKGKHKPNLQKQKEQKKTVMYAKRIQTDTKVEVHSETQTCVEMSVLATQTELEMVNKSVLTTGIKKKSVKCQTATEHKEKPVKTVTTNQQIQVNIIKASKSKSCQTIRVAEDTSDSNLSADKQIVVIDSQLELIVNNMKQLTSQMESLMLKKRLLYNESQNRHTNDDSDKQIHSRDQNEKPKTPTVDVLSKSKRKHSPDRDSNLNKRAKVRRTGKQIDGKDKKEQQIEDREKKGAQIEDKEKKYLQVEDKEKTNRQIGDKEKNDLQIENRKDRLVQNKERKSQQVENKRRLQIENREASVQQMEDKEKKVQQNEDKEKKVQQIEDREKKVQQIEDKEKKVHQIEDKEKKVQQIEDEEKKVQHIEDKEKKVHQIEDKEKKVQQIEDEEKKVHQIEDKEKKVQQIEDKEKKVQQIEDRDKKVHQIEDKKDQHIDDKKDQQIENKKDQQIEGKKDRQIEDKKDYQIEDKKDQQIRDKKDQQIRDKKDQQIRDKKDQQIEDKKNQQIKCDEKIVSQKETLYSNEVESPIEISKGSYDLKIHEEFFNKVVETFSQTDTALADVDVAAECVEIEQPAIKKSRGRKQKSPKLTKNARTHERQLKPKSATHTISKPPIEIHDNNSEMKQKLRNRNKSSENLHVLEAVQPSSTEIVKIESNLRKSTHSKSMKSVSSYSDVKQESLEKHVDPAENSSANSVQKCVAVEMKEPVAKKMKTERDTSTKKTSSLIDCYIVLERIESTQSDTQNEHSVKEPSSSITDSEKISNDSTIFCSAHTKAISVIKCINSEFLAASEDGNIYQYSSITGQHLHTFSGHTETITSLCLMKNSSGSHIVYSGSLDKRIMCHDIESKTLNATVSISECVQCLEEAWGSLFIGTLGGNLYTYNLMTGRLQDDSPRISNTAILMLKPTKEGARKVLIVASKHQEVTVRDALSGLLLRTVSQSCSDVTVYSLLLENSLVYCGTSHKNILVFDFTNGDKVCSYEAGSGVISMLMHGHLLFAGCYDGNIYVFDSRSHVHIATIPGPGGMLLALAVYGNKIIASNRKNILKIWDMPKGMCE